MSCFSISELGEKLHRQRLVSGAGGSQCGWSRRRRRDKRRDLRGRQQPGSPEAHGAGKGWGVPATCSGITHLVCFPCSIKLSYFPWVCLNYSHISLVVHCLFPFCQWHIWPYKLWKIFFCPALILEDQRCKFFPYSKIAHLWSFVFHHTFSQVWPQQRQHTPGRRVAWFPPGCYAFCSDLPGAVV